MKIQFKNKHKLWKYKWIWILIKNEEGQINRLKNIKIKIYEKNN